MFSVKTVVLTNTFLLLGAIPASALAVFSDVPASHPNADAIAYVQQQGIVSGYPDGTFKPSQVINRAEFTKLVTLSQFGQEMINMCATRFFFSDVPADAWYLKNICRAKDAHLIDGYSDGTFRPGNFINVAEAAKIIVLADVFGNPDNDLSLDKGGPWYESYIRYLAQRKAIPTSIATLGESITRGEMAEIIYRLKADVTNKKSKNYDELESGLTGKIQYSFLGDLQCFDYASENAGEAGLRLGAGTEHKAGEDGYAGITYISTQVYVLQQALKNEGFLIDVAEQTGGGVYYSSYFGVTTQKALVAFQQKYHLQQTGIADQPTLDQLGMLYGCS